MLLLPPELPSPFTGQFDGSTNWVFLDVDHVPTCPFHRHFSRHQLLRTRAHSFISLPGPQRCLRSRVRVACRLDVTSDVLHRQCALTLPIGRTECVQRCYLYWSIPGDYSFAWRGCPTQSHLHYDDINHSEREDDLIKGISYVLGGEAKCDRERYIRVAAIVIVTSEGIKNICFTEA